VARIRIKKTKVAYTDGIHPDRYVEGTEHELSEERIKAMFKPEEIEVISDPATEAKAKKPKKRE
jgi:hypothetical protein